MATWRREDTKCVKSREVKRRDRKITVKGVQLLERCEDTKRVNCEVVKRCVQTQRGIVGRGEMDVEGLIEYEGH